MDRRGFLGVVASLFVGGLLSKLPWGFDSSKWTGVKDHASILARPPVVGEVDGVTMTATISPDANYAWMFEHGRFQEGERVWIELDVGGLAKFKREAFIDSVEGNRIGLRMSRREHG